MYWNPLPEKEIQKTNKELLELHKRVCKTYLVSKNLKVRKRNMFFVIYDHSVNEKNIGHYFFIPIKYFVYLLITKEIPLWKKKK